MGFSDVGFRDFGFRALGFRATTRALMVASMTFGLKVVGVGLWARVSGLGFRIQSLTPFELWAGFG